MVLNESTPKWVQNFKNEGELREAVSDLINQSRALDQAIPC